MSKVKKGNGTEEYLRALWEELEAIELDNLVVVELVYHPDERKGVFCFHMAAHTPMGRVIGMEPVASIKAMWPNAQSADLGGFLFNQALKLGTLVQEALKPELRAPID